MLLFLSDRDSKWRAAANERIREFLTDRRRRLKSQTKDLGR
jgi:hypothetical protein